MIKIDTRMIIGKLITAVKNLLDKDKYLEVDSLISSEEVMNSIPPYITVYDDFMEPYCISFEDEIRDFYLNEAEENQIRVMKFYTMFNKYCIFLKVCDVFRLESSLRCLVNIKNYLDELKSRIISKLPEIPSRYNGPRGHFTPDPYDFPF